MFTTSAMFRKKILSSASSTVEDTEDKTAKALRS
jgi:hypothetical protein